MNSFKVVLLVGVLGMTWVDCGRRPEERTHAFPEAAFEAATTNALAQPVSSPHAPEPRDDVKGKFTLVRP